MLWSLFMCFRNPYESKYYAVTICQAAGIYYHKAIQLVVFDPKIFITTPGFDFACHSVCGHTMMSLLIAIQLIVVSYFSNIAL